MSNHEREDELRSAYIRRLPSYRASQQSLVSSITGALNEEGVELHSRIKPFEAVKAKLERRPSMNLDDVADVVGIRIVVPDRDALARTVTVLKSRLSHQIESSHDRSSSGRDEVYLCLIPNDDGPSSAAISSAEIQVRTAQAQALFDIEHSLLYKRPGEFEQRLDAGQHRVGDLDVVIQRFEDLLSKPDVHEKQDIHPFLKKHQFILHPNPDNILSEVALGLGTEFRADFVIRRSDGTYLLVELENPR